MNLRRSRPRGRELSILLIARAAYLGCLGEGDTLLQRSRRNTYLAARYRYWGERLGSSPPDLEVRAANPAFLPAPTAWSCRVPSHSKSNVFYQVSYRGDQVYEGATYSIYVCNCKGFGYRGQCSHITQAHALRTGGAA